MNIIILFFRKTAHHCIVHATQSNCCSKKTAAPELCLTHSSTRTFNCYRILPSLCQTSYALIEVLIQMKRKRLGLASFYTVYPPLGEGRGRGPYHCENSQVSSQVWGNLPKRIIAISTMVNGGSRLTFPFFIIIRWTESLRS